MDKHPDPMGELDCAATAFRMSVFGHFPPAVRSQMLRIRNSNTTRAGFLNAFCGVADYVSQPLGMLLAAPFLLHRLGLAQYGLWMIANAAISSSGLLSTGFSDMTLKYAAMYRGRDDWSEVVRVVRSSITINLALSGAIAVLLWIETPFAGAHIFRIQPDLQIVFVQSIRIGSAALLVRSLDSIFVSVLRAYERYRPAVQITVTARATVILSAVVLVAGGHGVVSIMVATLVVNVTAMLAQALAVRRHIGAISLLPAWNRDLLAVISPFGLFSWIQALSGIVFGQADRLIIGALLGSSAVAYYSVCVQAAQSIHGLTASGFHFLFPHLSAKHSILPCEELRSIVKTAFQINILLVALLCLPLVMLSKPIMTLWMGAAFAAKVWPLLSVIAIGFGLVGINVTAHYTLMAFGAVRYVTLVNVVAGLAMIGAIIALTSHFGLLGAGIGRLVYGPITWITYWKAHKLLRSNQIQTVLEPALTGVS